MRSIHNHGNSGLRAHDGRRLAAGLASNAPSPAKSAYVISYAAWVHSIQSLSAMSEADVAAAAAHTDPPQAPAAEPVAAPEVTPGAVATPRIAPADGAAPPATPTDDAAKDKKEKKSKKERSDKTGKEKKEKKHRDKKEKSHRSHRSHRSKAAGGDPTSNESPAYARPLSSAAFRCTHIGS